MPIFGRWYTIPRAKEGFQPGLIIEPGDSPETRSDALADIIRFQIRRWWPQDARFMHRQPIIRYNVLRMGLSTLLVKDLLRRGLTVAVFEWIEENEWVKSHQGEISTPPAHCGNPESLITCSAARDKPPPAESPMITMC